MIIFLFFLLFSSVFASRIRELNNPACAICSYSNGVAHKFYAAYDNEKNKLYEDVDSFAADAGMFWQGHRLCCDFDSKKQTIFNITNSNRQILTVQHTKKANFKIRKSFKAKSQRNLTDFLQSPVKCVILNSSNPMFNPYSPLLTPKNSATRSLLAFPYYIGKDFSCPADTTSESCPVTFSDTITTSITYSYSITDGSSNSYTNTIGTTSTIGQSNDYSTSISETLEESYSYTKTDSTGGSSSTSWSEAVTKSIDTQLNWSGTHTEEESDTNGSTNSTSVAVLNGGSNSTGTGSDHTWDNTAGGSVGWSAPIGPTGSVDYHHSDGGATHDTSNNELNFSNTTTGTSDRTSSKTSGHSDSSTSGGSIGFGVSDAITNTATTETNYQLSKAYTNGNSKSKTSGSTNSYSTSNTRADELSKAFQTAKNIDIQRSNTTETSISFTASISVNIKPGISVRAVYLFQVDSTQSAWSCLNGNGYDIVYTDIADMKTANANYKSITLIAPNEPLTFYKFLDNALANAKPQGLSNPNSIRSGNIITLEPVSGLRTPEELIFMTTDYYECGLSAFGEMFVRERKLPGSTAVNQLVWKTNTNVKRTTDKITVLPSKTIRESYGRTRLWVNEMGHLLLQVDNMFNNGTMSPYNITRIDPITEIESIEKYITVWSNVPKDMKYQIGIKGSGYTFMLQEFINGPRTWNLILYDGGGSKVWCATNSHCDKGGSGEYKFPLNYILPTDFPTAAGVVSDPHNYLNPKFTLTAYNSSIADSENTMCITILTSGKGITSPNGRFKLILDFSGNLLIKDSTRTMWESTTANLAFATPPYSLKLNEYGQLYILDSWNTIIFSTLRSTTVKVSSQYSIGDNGELSIKEKSTGNLLWSSFIFIYPTLGLGTISTEKGTICSKCAPCMPIQPNPLVGLWSNGSYYTPYSNYLQGSTTMCSPNKRHCLTTSKFSLIMTNGTSSTNSFYIYTQTSTTGLKGVGGIVLDEYGILKYFTGNATTIPKWKSTNLKLGVYPYKTYVTDNGHLITEDARKEILFDMECVIYEGLKTKISNGYLNRCLSTQNNTLTVKVCDTNNEWMFVETTGLIRNLNNTNLYLNPENLTLSRQPTKKWVYNKIYNTMGNNTHCISIKNSSASLSTDCSVNVNTMINIETNKLTEYNGTTLYSIESMGFLSWNGTFGYSPTIDKRVVLINQKLRLNYYKDACIGSVNGTINTKVEIVSCNGTYTNWNCTDTCNLMSTKYVLNNSGIIGNLTSQNINLNQVWTTEKPLPAIGESSIVVATYKNAQAYPWIHNSTLGTLHLKKYGKKCVNGQLNIVDCNTANKIWNYNNQTMQLIANTNCITYDPVSNSGKLTPCSLNKYQVTNYGTLVATIEPIYYTIRSALTNEDVITKNGTMKYLLKNGKLLTDYNPLSCLNDDMTITYCYNTTVTWSTDDYGSIAGNGKYLQKGNPATLEGSQWIDDQAWLYNTPFIPVGTSLDNIYYISEATGDQRTVSSRMPGGMLADPWEESDKRQFIYDNGYIRVKPAPSYCISKTDNNTPTNIAWRLCGVSSKWNINPNIDTEQLISLNGNCLTISNGALKLDNCNIGTKWIWSKTKPVLTIFTLEASGKNTLRQGEVIWSRNKAFSCTMTEFGLTKTGSNLYHLTREGVQPYPNAPIRMVLRNDGDISVIDNAGNEAVIGQSSRGDGNYKLYIDDENGNVILTGGNNNAAYMTMTW